MSLHDDGYVHLRAWVAPELVERANRAIDRDLRERYDPARRPEYDARSACPDLRAAPEIVGLIDPVRPLLDELLGLDRLRGLDHAQIAIRWARSGRPGPPSWHLDGWLDGSPWKTFTALVGVFLTATPGPSSGNLAVWPGSWRPLSAWFREDPSHPGEPVELLTRPGDVVLANYLLAHGAAPNASAVERRAVFFRLSLVDLGEHRLERVCAPWSGWRLDAGRGASDPSR